MKRVEIFKTNVYRMKDAQRIVATLVSLFSSYKINFDLDDEERILRINLHNWKLRPTALLERCLSGVIVVKESFNYAQKIKN